MDDFEEYYNRALKYLGYRQRCEKEVRNKLKEKGANPDVTEKVIAKLKEHKFINDEEFARIWIENRNRFKPRSIRLIKVELKQKGISEEIINSLESTTNSDLESATKLVEKRIYRFKGLGKQEIYQKLGRYLASKGFNWDTIKKAIDHVQLHERG